MARGRNVINQSIALEGGDEIVAMLRKMGEEGETAARKTSRAASGAPSSPAVPVPPETRQEQLRSRPAAPSAWHSQR